MPMTRRAVRRLDGLVRLPEDSRRSARWWMGLRASASTRVLALALGAAGLASACERSPNIVWHPTAENAPSPSASVISGDSIPERLSATALANWRRDRDLLLQARTVLSVGDDQAGPTLFGHISDAQVSSDGDLFVFDDQMQRLGRFASDGTYIDEFGGVGDGPTEFRYATGFILLRGGAVAVLDRSRLRLFTHDGDQWQFLRFVRLLTPDAHDACTADGATLFVSGPGSESDGEQDSAYPNIHGVSVPDGTMQSLGMGYRADAAALRWDLSSGPIACPSLHNTGVLLFAFGLIPVVRAYDRGSGELVWESEIADYLQLGIRQRPGTRGGAGATLYFGRDHDHTARVHQLPGGNVLVQTLRYSEATNTRVPRTYLVDGPSGIGALISETLPEIASFFDHGYVALMEDPFPRVEIRRYTDQITERRKDSYNRVSEVVHLCGKLRKTCLGGDRPGALAIGLPLARLG